MFSRVKRSCSLLLLFLSFPLFSPQFLPQRWKKGWRLFRGQKNSTPSCLSPENPGRERVPSPRCFPSLWGLFPAIGWSLLLLPLLCGFFGFLVFYALSPGKIRGQRKNRLQTGAVFWFSSGFFIPCRAEVRWRGRVFKAA